MVRPINWEAIGGDNAEFLQDRRSVVYIRREKRPYQGEMRFLERGRKGLKELRERKLG